MVMKDICEGRNKSGLYDHMKMLIEKGKEKRDGRVELIYKDGDTIDDEKMVKAMIEMFLGWFILYNYKWRCNTWQKERDCRWWNGIGYICEKEFKRSIKLLKEIKSTNESGMIDEYIKAMGECDSINVRMLNDVLRGGCIPKEWKESRVELLHKGGSKKEWHAMWYTRRFQKRMKDRE